MTTTAGSSAPTSAGTTPIYSPFDGKTELVEISVKVGDTVTEGQVLAAVEAMKAGAMDFVEKPADLDALSEKIKKAHHKKAVIVQKQSQDKVIEMLRKFGM